MEGDEMPEHKIGTHEEWQAARDELAKLEVDQAERNEEIKRRRLELPWVPVEKKYEFDTEDGKKTFGELFDGRSQLLAYNIMFGPDYTLGACPGCTSLGDGLDGSLVHLNHRDVTLLCFSRAPIERLTAYKRRMGWQFPYVSTSGQARSGLSSRMGCARTRAGSPSRARTGPSTTRTRCRRPTRSSRRTSACCSTEHRKHSPRSPALGGRTSTRTDADSTSVREATRLGLG